MRAAGRPDNPPRDEGTPDVPSTRLAPCTVRTVVATLSPVLDVTSRGRWGTAELRFSVPTRVPPSPRHPAPGRSGGRHRRALFCCRFAAEHTDLEGDVTWKRPPSVRGAPGSQTPWSGLRTTLWASRRPPLLGRPPPPPAHEGPDWPLSPLQASHSATHGREPGALGPVRLRRLRVRAGESDGAGTREIHAERVPASWAPGESRLVGGQLRFQGQSLRRWCELGSAGPRRGASGLSWPEPGRLEQGRVLTWRVSLRAGGTASQSVILAGAGPARAGGTGRVPHAGAW